MIKGQVNLLCEERLKELGCIFLEERRRGGQEAHIVF